MTVTVHHNSETGATRVVDTARPFTWDEPAGCATPRGWLHSDTVNACVGFYLDYGPDSYRPEHASIINTINGPMLRQWCQPGNECRECQPGNILAVRYPDGPTIDVNRTSRYVETIEQAREFIERGDQPA